MKAILRASFALILLCFIAYQMQRAPTTHKHPDGLSAEVWEMYQSSKEFIVKKDFESARNQLRAVVEKQDDFTEAWYNLGAAETRQALEEIRQKNDASALALYRSAVASKRRAKELMDQNHWYIYNAAEQVQVKSDVEEALKDADSVLADESSLLAAMRLWAQHI